MKYRELIDKIPEFEKAFRCQTSCHTRFLRFVFRLVIVLHSTPQFNSYRRYSPIFPSIIL